MYEPFFAMKSNPFKKDLNTQDKFETTDFRNVQSRLNYLLLRKGIGVFTGTSGKGKTFSIRYFSNNLNKNIYKIMYIPLSTLSVVEFYRNFCVELGLEPMVRKVDMFKQIQDRMVFLSQERKITPIIILDEAQYLKREVLEDLKMLLNFNMDSTDYGVLILVGQPLLNSILNRGQHEALKQRILVNYEFEGITKDEVREYIFSRCKIAGISNDIFTDKAIETLTTNSNGSLRVLNSLIDNSFLAAYEKNKTSIDEEIVSIANDELTLGGI